MHNLTLLERRLIHGEIEIITPSWADSGLAPVMSSATIRYHLGKLAHGYADRYNSGEGDPQFNYNGATLHNLFFSQFRSPRGGNKPNGPVGNLITSRHRTWSNFVDRFTEAALGIQGSGWAYMDRGGEIRTFQNHNMPSNILILVDMWEHAFNMDYGANKAKYLESIWRIMDWTAINNRWGQPYRKA